MNGQQLTVAGRTNEPQVRLRPPAAFHARAIQDESFHILDLTEDLHPPRSQLTWMHLILAIIPADSQELAIEGEEDAVAAAGLVSRSASLDRSYRGLLRSGADTQAQAEASYLSYTASQAVSSPTLSSPSPRPPPYSPKFSTTRPTWNRSHQQRTCRSMSGGGEGRKHEEAGATQDKTGGDGRRTYICPLTTATPKFSLRVVMPEERRGQGRRSVRGERERGQEGSYQQREPIYPPRGCTSLHSSARPSSQCPLHSPEIVPST